MYIKIIVINGCVLQLTGMILLCIKNVLIKYNMQYVIYCTRQVQEDLYLKKKNVKLQLVLVVSNFIN